MLRNYFLLNLLLILIIGILSYNLYGILGQSLEVPSQATSKQKEKEKFDARHRDRALSESAYEKISALDLFSPSRSEVPAKSIKKTEKTQMKNPPKLFGTIILNNNKSAILQDPETKSSKVYRLNDTIAGYKITQILQDKVVLTGDGDEVEVKLREDKGITTKKKARVQPSTSAVQDRRKSPTRRSRAVPPRRRPTRSKSTTVKE